MEDYSGFIELLMDVSGMSNHYHLLIQTHDANLSRCMRHMIGFYSKKNMSSILGSEKFIKWVKERFPRKRRKRRFPDAGSNPG